MSQVAAAPMDDVTFLDWRQAQVGRWELVGGSPVQLMAGARKQHDQIVVNLIAELRIRLRGTSCFPTTDDVASRMTNGNIRQPDVTIDCARGHGSDLTSTQPTVFFEVLSRSTRSFDFIVKAEEYKQVASLRHFLLIDADRPLVHCWTRGADGTWTGDRIATLDAEVDLAGVPTSLPMRAIYEDVGFDEA